jgi:hypothetical protein
MKKIFMMLLVVAISAGAAVAQDGNRPQRDGGKMREAMKEKLKTDLKFTDVQVDSIMSIQQEFMGKNREVRTNTALSDDDKKAKMQELNEARKKRLKTILNEDQSKQLEEFYENMRKNREPRQGQ